MMVIENKYEVEQIVYLKTDGDQLPRMVTSIVVNKYDLLYELTNGTFVSKHYDFEITDEKQTVIS
jgi:hypothetical protein